MRQEVQPSAAPESSPADSYQHSTGDDDSNLLFRVRETLLPGIPATGAPTNTHWEKVLSRWKRELEDLKQQKKKENMESKSIFSPHLTYSHISSRRVTGTRVHTFEFTFKYRKSGIGGIFSRYSFADCCFLIVTTILISYMWRQGKYFNDLGLDLAGSCV